jgi:hypothetical protein
MITLKRTLLTNITQPKISQYILFHHQRHQIIAKILMYNKLLVHQLKFIKIIKINIGPLWQLKN